METEETFQGPEQILSDNQKAIIEINQLMGRFRCECCFKKAEVLSLVFCGRAAAFCEECYVWLVVDMYKPWKIGDGPIMTVYRTIAARVAFLEYEKKEADAKSNNMSA